MLKRWLAVTLAALMLVGVLASCGNVDENPSDTKAPASSDTEKPAETREPLEIPETRYDGKELCFLTRDESEWSTLEIFSEGMTSESDNINNAVHERNLRILETYGVTVTELKENTDTHNSKLTNEIGGSTGDFMAVITNTSNSAAFSKNGYLWDLYSEECEYLDLSKSWWDQRMVEGLSINDRLYFATGDLLTADNDATFVLLFNKKILNNNQQDDPYALVANNQWTMQKFQEMAAACVSDQDGVSGLSYDQDISGYAYTGDGPYCFLFGGGITICQKNADDYPEYNLDIERASNISEAGKRIFDAAHAVNLNKVTETEGIVIMEVGKTCFGENHALFLGEVMQSVTRMRGFDVDFGILPYPKYDEQQANYYSMMHTTASMVSVPKSVSGDDLTMVCSMIEAMAYHSVDTLTVQYYDINLKTRDSKDEKSGPMIDMILANRACDLSYYYSWGSGAFGGIAGTLLPDTKTAVSSLNKKYSRAVDKDIDITIRAMDKNDK